MLIRRKYRNPRFILLGCLIISFLFILASYLQNEEIDTSHILKQKIKDTNRNENQLNPPNLKENINEKNKDEALFLVKKSIDSMQRLVHLDLKGAQPKLKYLSELIPFIKNAGATGVLIEYEDFFPYEHDLDSIKNQNHYTKQELTQIFKMLKDSDLNIIPLVQMYGHLEFVLKLKQFAHLREDKRHFQAITPCLNETYEKVLFKMLDQIIEGHPDSIEHIHIGCDEVYLLNKNPACKYLENEKIHIGDIFIKY